MSHKFAVPQPGCTGTYNVNATPVSADEQVLAQAPFSVTFAPVTGRMLPFASGVRPAICVIPT
jgi:hypothetical protein